MRRAPLILITEPQLISSGLQEDRHALFKPLWEVAENVRFYQGKVRRLVPPALAFQAEGLLKMRGLHQQQTTDGTRWIMAAVYSPGTGTPLKFYRWYGPAPELMTSINGARLDQIATTPATYADFTSWGNWTILNTGVGTAKLFKPGEVVGNLTNAPVDVVAFMKKQDQLLAIGSGLVKKGVDWTHGGDITRWDPTDTTSTAGSLTIEELDTAIRAAARLGPHVACYAEDQLALVSWIGAPFFYGQRVQLDGIGAVGKMAVCADIRLNYGVSRNGIWRTDGSDAAYIDEGILSEYLQENVNWEQASKIIAFRNDVSRCIEFHFPMEDALENNEGWSFDPRTGGWSKLPGYQVAMERKILDKPIVGSDGLVLMLDEDLGVEEPLDLRTKPLMAQTETAMHLSAKIDEIEIAAKIAEGVQFRYCVAENIDGPRQELDWQELSADMRTYQLEAAASGTYHWLEFRSTIASWDLDLQGFALFGEPDGVKRPSL